MFPVTPTVVHELGMCAVINVLRQDWEGDPSRRWPSAASSGQEARCVPVPLCVLTGRLVVVIVVHMLPSAVSAVALTRGTVP